MDDCIDREDVGPPGKAVKPTVEGVNFVQAEEFRENQENNSKNSVGRKGLFH